MNCKFCKQEMFESFSKQINNKNKISDKYFCYECKFYHLIDNNNKDSYILTINKYIIYSLDSNKNEFKVEINKGYNNIDYINRIYLNLDQLSINDIKLKIKKYTNIL